MTEQQTLLAIYAHPDDEILGPGGTMARCAAEGARVVLVTATRGEAGEIQRPGTATPETLPEVREQELRCSAEALGIDEVIILGYRDSGMAGTPENDHPDALVNAPARAVVGQLVGLIRRVQPQVVLTFEPYGGYGHPDHIAVNRHTVAAFSAASDPSLYPTHGPVWRPQRLIYPIVPLFLFEEMKERVTAHGGDTTRFDEMIMTRKQRAWPDHEIHIVVDVSEYVEQKWQAFHCHRTQFGPESRFQQLPEEEMKELLSTEYFALSHPAADKKLAGLFEGL